MNRASGIAIAATICCMGNAHGLDLQKRVDAGELWKCPLGKNKNAGGSHTDSRCYGVPVATTTKCKEEGGTSYVVEPTCTDPGLLSPPRCQSNVDWALREGIRTHPEWYGGKLTPNSNLEEVLDVIAAAHPRICLPACRGRPNDVPYPGAYQCKATSGEISSSRCVEGVHATVGIKGVDIETCVPIDRAGGRNRSSHLSPDAQHILSAKRACTQFGLRPVFRSPNCMAHGNTPPQCDKDVDWVLQDKDGVKGHPEWYPGLTPASTREEVMDFLATSLPAGSATPQCLPRCELYPKSWLPVKWPGLIACVSGSA